MPAIDPIFRPEGSELSHTVLGITHRYRALASETGGAFMTYEADVPPGAAIAMHYHENDAESFQMLEGNLTFITPDGERTEGPGAFVAFPAGCMHGVANRSGKPARALIIQAPGIEAEKFFFTMAAEPPREGQALVARIVELASQNGIVPCLPG